MFLADLVNAGMSYSNPTTSLAAPPFLVPKMRPEMFRFTVCFPPVNKFAVNHESLMPNIKQELTKLASSKYFATLHLSVGYWQLPPDEASHFLESFISPDGIFTPTCVLHGTTNVVTHLQLAFASLLPEDLKNALLH